MRMLHMKDLASKALALYRKGRLSAQSPDPACVYRDKQKRITYYCAIGASLTSAEHKKITQQTIGIEGYHGHTGQDFPVVFSDKESAGAFQGAHDAWARDRAVALGSAREGDAITAAEYARKAHEAEQDFLRLAKAYAGESR